MRKFFFGIVVTLVILAVLYFYVLPIIFAPRM